MEKRKKSVTVYLTDKQLDIVILAYQKQAENQEVLTFQRFLQECLVYGSTKSLKGE